MTTIATRAGDAGRSGGVPASSALAPRRAAIVGTAMLGPVTVAEVPSSVASSRRPVRSTSAPFGGTGWSAANVTACGPVAVERKVIARGPFAVSTCVRSSVPDIVTETSGGSASAAGAASAQQDERAGDDMQESGHTGASTLLAAAANPVRVPRLSRRSRATSFARRSRCRLRCVRAGPVPRDARPRVPRARSPRRPAHRPRRLPRDDPRRCRRHRASHRASRASSTAPPTSCPPVSAPRPRRRLAHLQHRHAAARVPPGDLRAAHPRRGREARHPALDARSRRSPAREQVSTFHCVTGWTVSNVHWEGVRASTIADARQAEAVGAATSRSSRSRSRTSTS